MRILQAAHPVNGRMTISTCWQMALLSAATHDVARPRGPPNFGAFHMAQEAARVRNV
jgi:hypothetical protein